MLKSYLLIIIITLRFIFESYKYVKNIDISAFPKAHTWNFAFLPFVNTCQLACHKLFVYDFKMHDPIESINDRKNFQKYPI